MAFQSGVAAVDSTPHLALTWLVAVVLVTCVALFLGMLAVEVWHSAHCSTAPLPHSFCVHFCLV
jgi:hypothetical protein